MAEEFDERELQAEWAQSLNDGTLDFALTQSQERFGKAAQEATFYRKRASVLTEERGRRDREARLAKGDPLDPCLETMVLHDYKTYACGRPKGHPERGGQIVGGHAERPQKDDPPTYAVEQRTVYEATTKVANP